MHYFPAARSLGQRLWVYSYCNAPYLLRMGARRNRSVGY